MTRPIADLLADSIADWDLSPPEEVARTPRAVIYRTTLPDGRPAALKLALPLEGDDESLAPAWLRWHDGEGVVRVYADAPDRLLLEWFDGPLLSSLCDAGRDDEATHVIADCVAALAAKDKPHTGDLMPFEHYARTLLTLDLGKLPQAHRDAVAQAKELCGQMIDSAVTIRPLHGDLHHENIAMGDRGWLVFDPKCVLGDPHFELANSFRNPVGRDALVADPDRPRRMVRAYAKRLQLDPARILNWVYVLSAMSVSWNLPRGPLDEAEYAMVHRFRDLARTGP